MNIKNATNAFSGSWLANHNYLTRQELTNWKLLEPRVSVIFDCPQKDLFYDLMNVILTSRAAVSEMVDNDNDNKWQLGKI